MLQQTVPCLLLGLKMFLLRHEFEGIMLCLTRIICMLSFFGCNCRRSNKQCDLPYLTFSSQDLATKELTRCFFVAFYGVRLVVEGLTVQLYASAAAECDVDLQLSTTCST